jgi:hypothetical protein
MFDEEVAFFPSLVPVILTKKKKTKTSHLWLMCANSHNTAFASAKGDTSDL